MRITPDLLHKFAQQTVSQRKRSEPDLHAAYLVGSVLDDDPLLGGSTDIDLVLVHKYQAPVARETIPVTPEISLDIWHKVKDDYEPHRSLRQNTWMGYPLTYNHILLFDTDHWLEFIQAGVSADFHRADNVLLRVNGLLNSARENWFSLLQNPPSDHLVWLHLYLETLALAAQTISGLMGPPLTGRRFISQFRDRVGALDSPEMLVDFSDLLGFLSGEVEELHPWIADFEKALNHLLANTNQAPVHLSACRLAYYLNAIRSLAESDHPEDCLWPLLLNWLNIQQIKSHTTDMDDSWQNCLSTLNLAEDNTTEKVTALDRYLDQTEILIEAWASKYGI